ncbi:NAD-dependent epimerase/dehydratase family protein [Kribbella jiaozuonensis]|uniref:NAD-dependent epimerase/dehydratase family protein n=1 Tax=Kribbella jiaozuonensis TaxID=2575441 RepID=A0A4V5UWK5_9ACTN|nr:NAD-dependent epimerase/dehydratase family protein [Kribbella jiaozuonensis]TKK76183.1 NAD-dependent epimerase/dehydratase family protein [Kribbella jiaozuonensis]
MTTYLVLGAGATGAAVARQLADGGDEVRLLSRRGSGPAHPRIERVPADANDAAALTEHAAGVQTIFNCAMPPYDKWPALFPPLAAANLAAAQRSGADYVMLGNIYAYGAVEGPLSADLPLAPTSVKGKVRARMWEDALAAHEAGRVRVTEVRASDFLGAGAVSPFTLMIGARVLAGEPAAFPGDLDAPHSWSYTEDAARTLIAAARSDHSWGRPWLVPSTSDDSARALAIRLAEAADVPAPRLSELSAAELEQLGRQDSIVAELSEMRYLLDRPTILDASPTTSILGIQPTAVDVVLSEMAKHHATTAG